MSSATPQFPVASHGSIRPPLPTRPSRHSALKYVNASPVFANTHRNQFRGPGTGVVNANLFKGFHVFRESEFKAGIEVFNLFNHPYLNLNNPQALVPSTANVNSGNYGTFGLITSSDLRTPRRRVRVRCSSAGSSLSNISST